MTAANSLVYVVDDDRSVRKGLTRLLKSANFNVETFTSADEFLGRTPHDGPCCAVLDIRMPGKTGMELHEQLVKMGDMTPIIFLSGHGDIPMTVKAMKKGAIDFLTKPVADADLLRAIEQALARAEKVRRIRATRQVFQDRIDCLTPRELEVFKLVVTGMLNKQIAHELGISEKTVKVHRGRVMHKMEVNSLADLVRIAERMRLT